jgi:hypothetical protein
MSEKTYIPDESYFFECVCGKNEHTLRFTADFENQELCLHVFLDGHNIFIRLWRAIKYVCGYKCKYGHFGEWLLENRDTRRLKMMCEKFLDNLQ